MLVNDAAEFSARLWLQLYRRAPIRTLAFTGLVLSGVVATAIYEELRTKIEREARLRQNSTYAAQAHNLDQTRANLESLLAFVENERKQLDASQRALHALKSEHDRLKPVLETDRKAIDALFAAQEARNQAALSTERWIGFGLGVIASLVASFVWAVGSYVVRRRRNGGSDVA